jgi:INO80 complex subunit Ies4
MNKTGPSLIAPLVTHKLGPKANQGAINAGLRALDRTGKPCRKWIKKGLQIKSFTGVIWQLPTWRAPKTIKIDSDRGTSGDSSLNVDSDGKENKCSSGLNSEGKSSSTGDVEMGGTGSIQGSSPAPVVAAEA